ncbi:yjeF N-terminal domain-containing protein 3 isoform X2 [Vulpes lagopus]|uniref:yjeF N-terminal domain-containing protein 3 isoform X2 n=1 Tax=Vulpes lagopus TaxID=494514 RepID=UPI001BC92CFF|nr:yjeF N-terminal domain-containing protein 3 isoform X2 [Vulpes lagopus]
MKWCQRQVPLLTGCDPITGGTSLLLHVQAGFPPFPRQLLRWHGRVKSACTCQPMAVRSAFAALSDWRMHRVGGRGMLLKGRGGGCPCNSHRLSATMSSAARPDPAETPEEQRFLSTEEAAALERELLEDYRFGRQQLVELCGHASAVAVTKVFPLPTLSRKQRTVLVVCGPEQNGAVGLVCARHLRVFEYEPTIFYPTRSLDLLHRDLTTQCEKMDIPFLSYLPTEVQLINDAYGLVVDAVLGPGVQPGEIGGPCTRALATLKLLSIPLVSLDIPSGWDAETGGGDSEDGLRPDVLVSLAAPKRCAGRFSGRHHFVAGRFVPDDVRRKFALRLPGYTGTDCVAAL